MSTVRWIDIASPELRAVHRAWCDLRGAHLLPHLKRYNEFLPNANERDSVCAVFPASAGAPAFRNVGSNPGQHFPELRAGVRFSEIASVVVRTALTLPFHEVCAAHQPDCRRGNTSRSQAGRRYEQLLVPFADDRLRVCLVHAVFVFGRTG